MSNVIDTLNYLYEVRTDIKDAIEYASKEEVHVPFINYADLINAIPDPTFSEERSNKLQFWMTFENSTIEDKTIFEQFDMTAKNGDFGDMFKNCKKLKYGPVINYTIKNVTGMFEGCSSLISVHNYDTGNCDDFTDMFNGCTNLTVVPELKVYNNYADNTGAVFARTFKNCKALTEINLDFKTNIGMGYLDETFYGCSNLTTLGLLKIHKNATENKAFYGCSNLTNVGGFYGLRYNLNLSYCPLITYESLVNIIDNITSLSIGSSATLKLHPDAAARLTDDLIKKATDKGWTISY